MNEFAESYYNHISFQYSVKLGKAFVPWVWIIPHEFCVKTVTLQLQNKMFYLKKFTLLSNLPNQLLKRLFRLDQLHQLKIEEKAFLNEKIRNLIPLLLRYSASKWRVTSKVASFSKRRKLDSARYPEHRSPGFRIGGLAAASACWRMKI